MILTMQRLSETLEQYYGLDADNPTDYSKRARNWRRLVKSKFGMPLEVFEELLNLQNGVCAICKQPSMKDRSGRSFNIDHDKTTKMIRGLLCYNCNRALGHFQDNPGHLLSAVTYLLRPPAEGLEPRPKARFERESGSGRLVRYDGSLPIRRTGRLSRM
jgi:hypothetical protein